MTSLQPLTKVLLVSIDKDESIVTFLNESGFKVDWTDDIDSAEKDLQILKPDLILISINVTGDHGLNFCSFVKTLSINPRPIIVFLVDSEKPDERIEVLRAGADDAITFPISTKELSFRIMAHIRRRQETHINSLTGLADAVVASNILESCLNESNDWALLSIDLDNLRIYNEAYGENRGDQMIKALAAVLKSVLTPDDFIAHLNGDDFIFVTSSNRAEVLAEEICRRFDLIAPRFYTQEDAKRSYVIGVGPNGIRRRIPLVSISIGVTAKGRRNFLSPVEVIQIARDMRYLAKSKTGSDWVSDRLRLPTSEPNQGEKRVKILVVEPDASMSLLLRDTLEMEGYAVDIAHSTKEAWNLITTWRPELILLEADFIANEFDGWELAKRIKQDTSLAGIWLVVTTKNPDHNMVLESGADLYLPKPYELQILFSEIRYLLRARIRSKILL